MDKMEIYFAVEKPVKGHDFITWSYHRTMVKLKKNKCPEPMSFTDKLDIGIVFL